MFYIQAAFQISKRKRIATLVIILPDQENYARGYEEGYDDYCCDYDCSYDDYHDRGYCDRDEFESCENDECYDDNYGW